MKAPIFISLIFLLLLTSCFKRAQENVFSDSNHLPGLGSPFKLGGTQSVLLLADYFLDPVFVDSVSGNEAFKFHLHKDAGEVVILMKSKHVPHYSEMKVWINGEYYSILLERSQKEKFTFVFDPNGEVFKNVYLFGEMNNWNRNASPLFFSDGVWQIDLELNPGRYQYQLMADGKEMLDPHNPNVVDNNIGGFNSLMTVGNVNFMDVPVLYTKSTHKEEIRVGFNNDPEKIFIFWQNHRLPVDFVTRQSNKLIITIPRDAETMDRSYIRLWSYNKHGVSNDLLIPLQKRQVVNSAEKLGREDVEASVLYFLMVDRFHNGNPVNDEPINDPDVLPPANYHGGDLAGVAEKIREGYFSDLGMNAIWLSPITQNPLKAYVEFPEPNRKYSGYHGYWPITLTTVDHRFGDSEDMHTLVNEAHANGMNVLLDYVSNHVHEENPLIKENPEWATELNLPDGRKNLRMWDEQRLTTWFDTFLPTLDLTIPEVAETMADSALFWIKEYNLDGFRHDATKHIPVDYWRTLTYKLKAEVMVPQNKRLYQIGETFGSRELIGSYVGSGLLDGQFDFNLYFDARSIFALDSESFVRMNQSLMETFSYYGTNHLMGNITGNHDLPRFISLASGDLQFEEDSGEAGWERDIQVTDATGYNKLSMLTAFIMTIPGVPVVYYGDEIGLPGGGDPDSRRPMRFDDLNENEIRTRNAVAQLGKMRQSRMSLIFGDFKVLHLADKTWVYARRYFNEITIVAYNKGSMDSSIKFELPEDFRDALLNTNFGNEVQQQDGEITLVLKPYSFEILTEKLISTNDTD